jgi:hypothetical protein
MTDLRDAKWWLKQYGLWARANGVDIGYPRATPYLRSFKIKRMEDEKEPLLINDDQAMVINDALAELRKNNERKKKDANIYHATIMCYVDGVDNVYLVADYMETYHSKAKEWIRCGEEWLDGYLLKLEAA